jgi:hypothetical protein
VFFVFVKENLFCGVDSRGIYFRPLYCNTDAGIFEGTENVCTMTRRIHPVVHYFLRAISRRELETRHPVDIFSIRLPRVARVTQTAACVATGEICVREIAITEHIHAVGPCDACCCRIRSERGKAVLRSCSVRFFEHILFYLRTNIPGWLRWRRSRLRRGNGARNGRRNWLHRRNGWPLMPHFDARRPCGLHVRKLQLQALYFE